MADTSAVFQTRISEVPTYEVVSQVGDVIWVKGNIRSGTGLANRHALVSIPSEPYQRVIDNNNFKVGLVGPMEVISGDAIKDEWELGSPVLTSSGSNYYEGEVISLALSEQGEDLPDINFVVTAVDANGGIVSMTPKDPTRLPNPVDGVVSVSSPSSPDVTSTTTDENDVEHTVVTNPSAAASATVSSAPVSSGSGSQQPTSIEATRIVLSDHQGGVVNSIVKGNNGYVYPHMAEVSLQNLVGKRVALHGLGAAPSAGLSYSAPQNATANTQTVAAAQKARNLVENAANKTSGK